MGHFNHLHDANVIATRVFYNPVYLFNTRYIRFSCDISGNRALGHDIFGDLYLQAGPISYNLRIHSSDCASYLLSVYHLMTLSPQASSSDIQHGPAITPEGPQQLTCIS